MRIDFVEIANFRKLLAVRIDFDEKTTLLVGANNSGKTSAMLALRYFLSASGPSRFCLNDFTLCHWPAINGIGDKWVQETAMGEAPDLQIDKWLSVVPSLDLWFQVEDHEIHRVSKLIPTLDWTGGRLGIRLRFEPKDPEILRKEYRVAIQSVEVLKASQTTADGGVVSMPLLWPPNLSAYLDDKQRLKTHFEVRAYALDPSKIESPKHGTAQPQTLSPSQEAIDAVNLKSLVRIDEINAQRVFGDESDSGDGTKQDISSGSQLSRQLRKYYGDHLDPLKDPDIADLKALGAIEEAQKAFDQRLAVSFKEALDEVQGLGYPGVSDPKITISTRLKPVEGLDHETAVQYEIDSKSEEDGGGDVFRLPEFFNGLGYQNLVSMIFRLMSFRDAWMRVGKASKGKALDLEIPPLHLVLVEEPEAHLHVQVQQVFIRKAYDVLRKHTDLGANKTLRTQLVVSTHSSHVTHEAKFGSLRYFRRLPAGTNAKVPISTVMNLSEVFGAEKETERFVTRYLKAQHCDLFFADAAILVEGPAERMLVPHFIGNHYPNLNERYITMLEIGGSHAHRLKPLIEKLQLSTLVITDLDSMNGTTKAPEQPVRGTGQKTNNDTLKSWVPRLDLVDALCALTSDNKFSPANDKLFAVRVCYQIPRSVTLRNLATEEVVPYTFEDAVVFENLDFFTALNGKGLLKKFHDAVLNSPSASALGKSMFDDLRTGKKADFALDVMDAPQFDTLKVPTYIAEGLDWLQKQLIKDASVVFPDGAPTITPA